LWEDITDDHGLRKQGATQVAGRRGQGGGVTGEEEIARVLCSLLWGLRLVEKFGHDTPNRPDVDAAVVLACPVADLGGTIVTRGNVIGDWQRFIKEGHSTFDHSGHAEVAEFEQAVGGDKDVLWGDVAVRNGVSMEVLDGAEQLIEQDLYESGRDDDRRGEEGFKSVAHVLHGEDNMLCVLGGSFDVQASHYVRMVEQTEKA